MKNCSYCKKEKSLEEFHREKSKKDGLASYCKSCNKLKNIENYNNFLIRKRQYSTKRKHAAEYAIIRKYGVTRSEYLNMLNKQNNTCFICNKPSIKKNLCIDHDHKTNKVRGLLCNNCNSGLGFFKDNIEVLLKATEYLKKYK